MLLPTPHRHRDPFALMRSVMHEFDRAFAPVQSPAVFPAVNMWEGDEVLAFTAELPGIERSDIDITVEGDVLTLSGERKAPDLPEDINWHRRERGYGTFRRSVRLPFEADESKVEARFRDGVLRVVVARPEESRPRRVEVKVTQEEDMS